MTQWTPEDSAAALAEGWDVWDSDGSVNGPWQICVLEEPYLLPELGYTEKKFADDDEVWVFVWDKAQEGSELHRKALDFVKEHNPQEYAFISVSMKKG